MSNGTTTTTTLPPATAYRPILAVLRDDLLTRGQEPSVRAMLESAWRKESTAQRTADPFEVWCRGRATQVAAAWVLSVVFVRTLEDRGYLARRRIAGEGADDSEQQFVSVAPFLSARDYLLTVFREVGSLPGAEEIFDVQHNPVWVFGPSSEAARKLIDFFRQVDDVGQLRMRYEGADTRFLGDLYQDLDEDVRSRYALLQTPEFVEEFILGETLDPAIRTFGLKEVKLIDPTCGSGHFLLGAFHRLLAAWKDEEPGTDVKVLAQRALAQVYGTDLNPYAVAIARFRLTMAFMQSTGTTLLRDAPPLHLNLAVADSLLHGRGETQMGFAHVATPETRSTWGEDLFALEDEAEAMRILGTRYQAVVGNPPYITVKDASLRDKYRELYQACHRGYSLVAPFLERFFDLAREGGYVGAIVGNAFMKREFGSKLIEEVLPRYELTQVVDTSGAYIPGHGTPTAILLGRNQRPGTAPVLAVMGKRGEPSTPDDPAAGLVWSSIRDHHRDVGFENDYVSVAEVERERFAKHPWSLGGGGAAELRALLEDHASTRLQDAVAVIGFAAITGEDNLFLLERGVAQRQGLTNYRPLVHGEVVRDWSAIPELDCLWPNTDGGDRLDPRNIGGLLKFMWPYRRSLQERRCFGVPVEQKGIPWWAVREVYRDRFRTPLSIAFAFVATHNHFVLDRGGKVFKQSAPIIKLPEGATEEDHLALLAYLNSSTACFWMKQVCHKKSNASQKHHTDPARAAYEFAGTALQALPLPDLPKAQFASLARRLSDTCSQRAAWLSGSRLHEALASGVARSSELRELAAKGWRNHEATTQIAAYLQEELDWAVYSLSRLCDSSQVELHPELDLGAPLGSRPFELETGYDAGVSERARHDTKKTDEVGKGPAHWATRGELLSVNEIRLIETREFKRTWRDTEMNIDQSDFRQQAERDWMLAFVRECAEEAVKAGDAPRPTRTIVSDLSCGNRGPTLAAIAAYFEQELDVVIEQEIARDAVPFLSAYRYADSGMEKRAAWEHTWDLQRREDAGEDVGPIPVPPKYDQKDFRSPTYWQLRGKLDVPKERFISYPGCESDDDPSPLIGWAGWDHLQQAQALAGLYQRRKDEDGWGADRLTPMLAGLLELVPWLKQWHNEPDEHFGGARAGDSFDGFVREQALQLGLTLEDLRAWRPAQTTRGRAKKAAGAPKAKANGPTPEAVVEAVQSLADAGDGTVAQTALAEALGVSSAAAGKLAAALVEQGKLEMVSARPKKYRRGNW